MAAILRLFTSLGGSQTGYGSTVRGLSNDGSVAVGDGVLADNTSDHAFRWTQFEGMVDLGALGGPSSCACGVSADGSVVVGRAAIAGGAFHAFLWTAPGMVDLGTLGGDTSWADAVSADGATVVGKSKTADGVFHAFRWTQAGGMVDLGVLGGSTSEAAAVSSDGSVVVGNSQYDGSGNNHAFRWTQAGGMVDLGTRGGLSSSALGVSADGSVVVGDATDAPGNDHAFRWTQAGGMIDLGTFGGTRSGAYAVSGDGAAVVGWASPSGDATQAAFQWTQAGMNNLSGFLTGVTQSWAMAISGDGMSIGGYGYTESYPNGQGWTFAAVTGATIGRIIVPTRTPSNTFPLVTDFAHGMTIGRTIVAHSFADGSEQRFYVGAPATRYAFVRHALPRSARATLAAFWQATQGCVLPFYYSVPQQDGTFVTKTVRFENTPLSLQDLTNAITSVGVTFVEIPDISGAPVYASTATVTRFPDSTLATALLQEVQEIVPLVHIRVLEAAVADIYLSDRLLTLDGQAYQPRLLRVGDQGGDVLVEQKIDGSTDDLQFTFGNADRVMIALGNDTELIGARVELSLLHVASLRKLDLWAGDLTDWGSDTGPEFTVRCSDHLSALTLSSPVGTCSRTCWRRYGQDGCPATIGTQALDMTHFPSADAATCDQGYETDNGCLAHSGGANPTKHCYGGVWAKPQQVRIDDNSTGLVGIGRATITPTSQISDSIWGQTIPEIWHDDDGIPQRGLPVTCRIAAGREESDFYIALGLVGKGPLGAFTTETMIDEDGDGVKETFIGSTLDGQPNHGWTVDDQGNPTGNSLGLRQALGADPAGSNDFFSLGRVGTMPTSWREVVGGASCYEDTYAAGVAFCEIRRTDQKGVQLTTVDSHAMIAMISKGLTAWVWDTSGVRTASLACTNPVWVAINTYLRAIGLGDADAATQAATFDVGAAVAAAATADAVVNALFGDTTVANASDPIGDTWSGCDGDSDFYLSHPPLSIVSVTVGGDAKTVSQRPDTSGEFTWAPGDTLVHASSPIVGSLDVAITFTYAETYTTVMGTEKQFRFKGTVDASKPTRDWLRDILNNNLGYFTWSFGMLKVGCRNTATPVSAFVPGNILFNSLRLDPLKPGFEKLTVDFADEEYQFAHNTVIFTDQDYAARHGRVANPRASEFGLVGSSTKSQAMRVAVCRTREELGGVGDTEQKQARNASWRSTVLALDVEAGAVVSLADSELAGGIGTFRAQSWRLNRDWSVDLVGKTVRASMYDLTIGAVAPTVTSPTPPPSGVRDTGAPPTPTFAARVSPVDASSLQIYGLAFPQTTNTRTISSATFTISFSGGVAAMVQSASFPQDFFSSSAASGWSLSLSLPGKTVTGISGFVTNAYGNSDAYALTVTLALSAVALSSGTGTTGDAAVFDASGKIVDAGAAPVLTSRQVATTAPLTGGGDLTANRTLAISAFTGDAGAGGAKGAVPAPAAGDAAGGKFLKADASWAVPPGTGVPTARKVATTAPLTGGGDLTADRTLAISTVTGDAGAGGAAGAVPAPAAGDAAAGKFLKADASWAVPPYVPTARKVSTTAPLTGGGDLTADRTLAISAFTGDAGSGGAAGAVPAPAAGDAAAGKFLKANGSWASPPVAADIAYVIDGAGAAITTGLKGYLFIDFACTINQWTLMADRSGSAVVDIWACSYAAFDAGVTHPVSGDKITSSAPPTLSSVTKNQDANLVAESWTVSVTAGTVLAFNVTSAATVQRLVLSLKITKS